MLKVLLVEILHMVEGVVDLVGSWGRGARGRGRAAGAAVALPAPAAGAAGPLPAAGDPARQTKVAKRTSTCLMQSLVRGAHLMALASNWGQLKRNVRQFVTQKLCFIDVRAGQLDTTHQRRRLSGRSIDDETSCYCKLPWTTTRRIARNLDKSVL